jgi:hypothetical protein
MPVKRARAVQTKASYSKGRLLLPRSAAAGFGRISLVLRPSPGANPELPATRAATRYSLLATRIITYCLLPITARLAARAFVFCVLCFVCLSFMGRGREASCSLATSCVELVTGYCLQPIAPRPHTTWPVAVAGCNWEPGAPGPGPARCTRL